MSDAAKHSLKQIILEARAAYLDLVLAEARDKSVSEEDALKQGQDDLQKLLMTCPEACYAQYQACLNSGGSPAACAAARTVCLNNCIPPPA